MYSKKIFNSSKTNSWTSLKESMPIAVAYPAGAVLGSEFWVMGGSDDSGQKTTYIQVHSYCELKLF
jgi:N-acetylneuraminic acid mutarotase